MTWTWAPRWVDAMALANARARYRGIRHQVRRARSGGWSIAEVGS